MAMIIAGTMLPGLTALAQDDSGVAKTEYQDWQVRCRSEGDCAAVHQAGSVYIAVRENPQGEGLSIAIIVHPQAQVGTPVGIRLDNGWEAQLKVARCGENFCEAPIAPDSADTVVAHLKEDVGGVVAYPVSGEMSIAAFSLAGFAEAVAAISQ